MVPRTLDLIGHATASAQLRLGSWVLDATHPGVARWFRELAVRGTWARLGIHAIRLLGCRTAATEPGRATICALAELAGVEVHGARELLHASHYDPRGFREIWEFLLVSSSQLRRTTRMLAVGSDAWPRPRVLDLDALPALALGPSATGGPRPVSLTCARAILALVQRDAGAPIPGRAPAPLCELALPSARTAGYRLAQVLHDAAFLRFFPDGTAAPGIAYPVREPGALRAILDRLSPVAAAPLTR